MKCLAAETLILERLQGAVASEEAVELESHVLECQTCRAFQDAQRALDRALAGSLVAPRLSPQFRIGLNQRIRAEKRRVVWHSLPDLLHVGGGMLATSVSAVSFPAASALILPAGILVTLGTYALQSAFRFWVEELEDL